MDKSVVWDDLPVPRGLDPLYFDRRRCLVSALKSIGTIDVQRVVDVGANIGDSTENFLSWFPETAVVAFEPLPVSFKELTKRRETYWSSREVYLRPIALSDSVGSKVLFSSLSQTENSSFARVNRGASTRYAHRGLSCNSLSSLELDESDVHMIEVPVATLDQHFSSLDLPESLWLLGGGVDILKIDTQSWDLHVLRGGERLLKRTSVVLLEWIFDDVYGEPTPLYKLDLFMHNNGFRLWDISHIYKDFTNLRTLWIDLVYVHSR